MLNKSSLPLGTIDKTATLRLLPISHTVHSATRYNLCDSIIATGVIRQ